MTRNPCGVSPWAASALRPVPGLEPLHLLDSAGDGARRVRTSRPGTSRRARGPAPPRRCAPREPGRSCRRAPPPDERSTYRGRPRPRMPGTLFTATPAPTPLPQIITPRSARPSRTVRASDSRVVGIVGRRLAVGADVDHLVSAVPQQVRDERLQMEAGVVRSYRHPHRAVFRHPPATEAVPPRRTRRTIRRTPGPAVRTLTDIDASSSTRTAVDSLAGARLRGTVVPSASPGKSPPAAPMAAQPTQPTLQESAPFYGHSKCAPTAEHGDESYYRSAAGRARISRRPQDILRCLRVTARPRFEGSPPSCRPAGAA